MDGVPYPQPLAGPEPQYVLWGVLLVRPIDHPPRPVPLRAADQRSRAYPTLLRVLRWGRYGHRGGPQTPEVGSLACAPRGPFFVPPPFSLCGLRWLVSRLSGVGWWWWGGGGCSLFLAVLLAGVSPPPLVVVRGRCVCLWRGACARGVCVGVWCVVCGVWCAVVVCWWGCGGCVVWLVPRHSRRRFLCATPRHSWLGFAAGGGGRSSPLLAEGPGRGSPPLLAGFRCRRWCVLCGVWCAACGVRRWRVWWVCGWCGWSLATPGGGSCVLLPATPGWVSLPVVVWCGGAVGVSSGCPSPWPWCVCVRCVALRVGVGGVGGGGGRAWCGCRACACVCSRCVVGGVGCVIPWLVLVVGRRHVSKGRRRGPVDA